MQENKKLLICGTGRAGTTLLMRILTVAGFDTGFDVRDLRRVAGNLGRAGLEKTPNLKNKDNLPQVLKSPHLVDTLPTILAERWFEIGMVIVPIRELDAAAQSRVLVHEKALANESNPRRAPGGLWKTKEPRDQKWVLAEQFYRTIEPLVAYDVPYSLMSFPRFAQDPEYFDAKFATVLKASMGFDRSEIMEAFTKECRPEMISIKSD